jgi:hypothetical protein
LNDRNGGFYPQADGKAALFYYWHLNSADLSNLCQQIKLKFPGFSPGAFLSFWVFRNLRSRCGCLRLLFQIGYAQIFIYLHFLETSLIQNTRQTMAKLFARLGLLTLILFLLNRPLSAQLRKVYLDSDSSNVINRISFFSANEGYVAFTKC